MLRRSNPPAPLGPTAAHLPASIFMLYALTFRVFLLAVATSVTIMAPYAFKKIWQPQTRTRGPVLRAPGMSSLFYDSCCTQMPPAPMIFAERGPKSAGQGEGGPHRIQKGQDIGYTPVRIANRRNVYP